VRDGRCRTHRLRVSLRSTLGYQALHS
jgi:hypothetical protein